MKLACEKLSDAHLLFNHYSVDGCFDRAKSLEMITQCLLKAIDIKATNIFQVLNEKFHPYVERDPELGGLLDRVGEIYFGVFKQRQPSMVDMMSKMLGM